ncbi:hypothetical protein BCR42DRAFT_437683 [Absidia repens]|uniref:Uncharacterized protein n=1 Tax=Absidia repens TaxID=90262 RepID=A0A1X2IH83_9FUNG|nr:hypothetical protein BCR42DRAFT_437683 [Absidia repens]
MSSVDVCVFFLPDPCALPDTERKRLDEHYKLNLSTNSQVDGNDDKDDGEIPQKHSIPAGSGERMVMDFTTMPQDTLCFPVGRL